jgi:hypothetical protein
MNCINHPETPVSAYCQNCGKALCQECVRSVGGVVYCEPCLEARLKNPGAGPVGTGPGSVPLYVGLPASGFPNPGLALGLGFIPGVGAMYNGQFVKGLAHVIIFALLVSLANHEGPLGILVAFWMAYQVFDSYQTARARRDGTPLPNPFGLNDLGFRLGLQQHPDVHTVPGAAPYTASATGVPPAGTAPGQAAPYVPYPPAGEPPAAAWTSYAPHEQAGYAQQAYSAGFVPGTPDPSYAPGYTQGVGAPPPPYPPSPMMTGRSDIPTGAIVLIALGVLFLLGSLGIFHDDWISRGWPLAIVGVGVWLVVRRMRESKFNAPPQPGDRNPR